MSLTEIVTEFNKTFLTFIGQMAEIKNQNIIVPDTYSHAETIIMQDNFKIIDIFVIHVLPHKDKIMSDDESYFLNNQEIDNKYKNEIHIIEKIMEFKKLWLVITSDEKDVVKSYLKLLCIYTSNYFNKKYVDGA